MAYFVTALSPYSDVVYPRFLDDARKEPFNDVKLIADPDSVELNVVERENLERGRTGMGYGYPVDPNGAPKKMLWSGRRKPLPEAIMSSFLAVSGRFRNLVEQYEPDIHQFVPVEIYQRKDTDPVATFYCLNVCNRLDSLDKEKTTHARKLDYLGAGFWSSVGIPDAKIVISRDQTQGCHLWYDPYLMGGVYCSESFGRAALDAGFLGLSVTPREDA